MEPTSASGPTAINLPTNLNPGGPSGIGPPPSGVPGKKKRQRKALSCAPCRHKKLKCDRERPCSQCARRNQPDDCVYESNDPGLRRGSSIQTPSGEDLVIQHIDRIYQDLCSIAEVQPKDDEQSKPHGTITPALVGYLQTKLLMIDDIVKRISNGDVEMNDSEPEVDVENEELETDSDGDNDQGHHNVQGLEALHLQPNVEWDSFSWGDVNTMTYQTHPGYPAPRPAQLGVHQHPQQAQIISQGRISHSTQQSNVPIQLGEHHLDAIRGDPSSSSSVQQQKPKAPMGSHYRKIEPAPPRPAPQQQQQQYHIPQQPHQYAGRSQISHGLQQVPQQGGRGAQQYPTSPH